MLFQESWLLDAYIIDLYNLMLAFTGSSLPKNDKKSNKQSVDPTVIDEALISKAVRDFNTENKIITTGQITLIHLRELSLSFKNIWKISNLQGLERLEKLQLDNNIIEEIENIDHLVNLKWLDLSFNAIKEIKGLDNLVNLTDLSLYNNQITQLKGLDNCKKLNVFSIGNNKIPSFEIIQSYFAKGMRFKSLQVLNVAGNPFTKEPEYKNHLISQLPNLRYIDYTFIDDTQRKQIRDSDEKFRADTMTQEEYLSKLRQIEDEEKKNSEANAKIQNARMDLVENLSEELVQDEELDRVKQMRGVDEEISKFQEKIRETVENLQKSIITRNSEKLQAIEKFKQAVIHREADNEKETIEILRKFEHNKKIVFRKHEHQEQDWETELNKLYQQIEDLKDNLLYIENQIVEDMEIAIKEFDGKLQLIAKEMQDYITGDYGFKKILDAIKDFGQKLQELTKSELDRFQLQMNNNQDLPPEMDDDLIQLLENKETLLGTIGNIKDSLTQKANAKESSVTTLIDKDVRNLITAFKDKQYERNRKNVQQIHTQIQEYRKQFEELQRASDNESDNNN